MQHPPAEDGPPPGGEAGDEPGDKAGDQSVSRGLISESPEEILAYWTPERMTAAKPREVRLPDPAEDSGSGSG